MSRVNPLSSLSLLAVLVLAGCSSQAPQPLKKGEKAIDVASVVRQKMPASVKDRDAWAKDLATTFESQGLAPTLEKRLLGAGGGAAGVKLSGRSGCSGLKQDRLARD